MNDDDFLELEHVLRFAFPADIRAFYSNFNGAKPEHGEHGSLFSSSKIRAIPLLTIDRFLSWNITHTVATPSPWNSRWDIIRTAVYHYWKSRNHEPLREVDYLSALSEYKTSLKFGFPFAECHSAANFAHLLWFSVSRRSSGIIYVEQAVPNSNIEIRRIVARNLTEFLHRLSSPKHYLK